MITDFMSDSSALDMFITGRAGTGKTTLLAELITGLDNYTVCAYTHKACDVLRSKLPQGSRVQTLHSYLKKRPTTNGNATRMTHVDGNAVQGESEKVRVMFLDEYSMIGENDLMDIRALDIKVVWLGDPHQLPPVGDVFTLKPYGDYQVTLTKIYRQAKDNPLMSTLNQLVSFIEGAPPVPLIESANFSRGRDLVSQDHSGDSVMLAFTNRRVQELNEAVQGRARPEESDELFSPTTKQYYEFGTQMDSVTLLDRPFGGELQLNSKYKTLEHLLTMDDVRYCHATNGEEDCTLAYIFGHQNYLDKLNTYKKAAVASNKAIPHEKPAVWARENREDNLAKTRAKAWRNFLTFKECVICLDFTHAMTVHKSQGSTYDTVYLDTQDIGKAADFDYSLYLKLMYVGMSRASNKVVTN